MTEDLSKPTQLYVREFEMTPELLRHYGAGSEDPVTDYRHTVKPIEDELDELRLTRAEREHLLETINSVVDTAYSEGWEDAKKS